MPRRPIRTPALPESFVDSPAAFTDCLDHFSRCTHIAFDTEFVGEHSYRPELCLIQVATEERLIVIDPFSVGPLEPFWELLADRDRQVVVHAGREEIRMCRYGIGRPPANLIDLQVAAGFVGLTYPISYAGLVHDVLGERIAKGETLTDWRRRPLTPAQMKYAFDDVRFLLPAWSRLTDALNKRRRMDWVAEEFQTSVRRALNDEDPTTERWRKVKGLGGLDRRGLAVARELIAWRDRTAERQNRPPRTVVRDDLIAELARRQPRTLEDLAAVRGIPKSEQADVLAAVRIATSSRSESWPDLPEREIDPPNLTLLTQLLNVVLAEFADRERLAVNLCTTQSDLRAVVRSKQSGEPIAADNVLASGWRSRVVLPHLLAVLDGTKAVRVSDPNAIHPIGVVELRKVGQTPMPVRES